MKHSQGTLGTSTKTADTSSIVLHIDGASRGNPGPAAFAVVVETQEGRPVTSFSKCLGRTTNNVAEYQGLLAALEHAVANGYARVRVLTDSELMVRQIHGRYKVRSKDLKPLHEKALDLISRFESFSIQHVPRERNQEADRLANQALDGAQGGTAPVKAKGEADGFSPPAPEPLRARATYQGGILKLDRRLPLRDGQEVELEIRRKE